MVRDPPLGGDSEDAETPVGATENWTAWEPSCKAANADYLIVQVQEARKILGAQHCRTQSELKQRLLIISKTEHPDHGGDPERWRKLHGAYVFLHERLKPELSQSYDLK